MKLIDYLTKKIEVISETPISLENDAVINNKKVKIQIGNSGNSIHVDFNSEIWAEKVKKEISRLNLFSDNEELIQKTIKNIENFLNTADSSKEGFLITLKIKKDGTVERIR